MIRPVLTEVALFLTPFVLYAAYLIVTRAGLFQAASWPPRILAWLTGAALLLMIGSLIVLAHFSGAPAGSDYVPPHMEDGKLVPGQLKR